MAPVFRLTSDRYFIRASEAKDNPDIVVHEYLYDPYEVDIMRPDESDEDWGDKHRVGPSERAEFKALEVFGVVIRGRQWGSLLRDLKLEGPKGETLHLLVNRIGLCFVPKVTTSSGSMLRINDYFGWSKYGVKLPRCNIANVWNRCDIHGGATVVDVRGIMVEADEAKDEVNALRRNLRGKVKEVEDGKLALAVCSKELECTKEVVERSKEKEMLLNRLVEEKEREVEEVNDQLLAFKAALGALVSQVEQEY